MEAVLRASGRLLMGMAERRSQRRSVQWALPQSLLLKGMKFLLHLCGFGAFVWTGFQLHSVFGGLAIVISCFTLSWLLGGNTSEASTNNVR